MNEEQQQQTKKSKKFAVGDLPPSPTTSTGTVNAAAAAAAAAAATNKRPVRHHVKRRSSGRVHVSKLAPMAKAQENEEKKPMKRSQSNKSLNRLSLSERKMTAFTSTAATVEPEAEPEVEQVKLNSPPTTPPPVNDTIDKTPIPEHHHHTDVPEKKPHLKSQFVNKSIASAAIASGITRTQQKLLLQREQSLIHDENNIAHPKNMIRLTREMEKMGKEYRCVRKYQDPMMESLVRCQEKLSSIHIQRSLSSNTTLPHMEQRRQILLKTALQQQHQYQQEEEDANRWNATNLLERLFYGTS